MFPSKIESFHKFAKGLSAFGKYNTSENARELRRNTIEELSAFLNSIENEYNHLLFHISELLHISGNNGKLDEYIFKAIVENIHNNSFKSYVNGFAFLLVNSSGDYRHRWNTLKGRIYQLFEQTDFVLQRITEFEKAIALAETGENSNCTTPSYRYTTHLSKIRSFHEFVNRLVKFCKKRPSEDINNLVQGFIQELHGSLDKLKAESSKLLYYISNLFCISSDLEKLDEYILKAILENICADSEESFKKNITGFVVLLITSSEDYISRFSAIKECLNRTLGNSKFVMQRIGEFEKFIIPKKTKSPNIKEKIYIATNEVRRIIAESEQIINAVPLDLEALSKKTETLCNHFDFINDLMVNVQIKEMPFPLKHLNDKYIKPLLQKTTDFSKYSKETKAVIKMLLDINKKLIKYVSFEDTKLLFNLFDRIEYLRLHKELWLEYNFKETVKQAHEVGGKTYNNLESYKLSQNQKETCFGRIGEICRDMVQYEVCKPEEKIDLLLKSNEILQKSIVRNGELVLKYFGRNYLRIGFNFRDLEKWEDAIKYFKEIENIDEARGVVKKIAFEARDNIAECYFNLALEAQKYNDQTLASEYFKFAEEYYNKADTLSKSTPREGQHILGKRANLYFFSQQYERALPIYKEILQNESSAPLEDKNLYDCFSYNWGVCLFEMNKIDDAINKFETTLKRNPKKEYRPRSYAWLIRLYGLRQKWDKQKEIQNIFLAPQ